MPDSPDNPLDLSDVTSDEADDQDVASRTHRDILDDTGTGTLGDGQIDAAATDPSPDTPTDEESEL